MEEEGCRIGKGHEGGFDTKYVLWPREERWQADMEDTWKRMVEGHGAILLRASAFQAGCIGRPFPSIVDRHVGLLHYG
jgi:hypothetical protein